jgi:hypothetical protein
MIKQALRKTGGFQRFEKVGSCSNNNVEAGRGAVRVLLCAVDKCHLVGPVRSPGAPLEFCGFGIHFSEPDKFHPEVIYHLKTVSIVTSAGGGLVLLS